MDFEAARHLMIEQQLRPWGILNQDILDLVDQVHREDYVAPDQRALAFVDTELPLPCGQKMWVPKFEMRVVQEVQAKPHDTVLLIGAGSGYLAALLAHRAKQVTTVEIRPEIVALARENLKRNGVLNAHVIEGNGAQGWANETYDVIVVSGSLPQEPDALFNQLKADGRLFAVIGQAPVMHAMLFTKIGIGLTKTRLFETVIEPLEATANLSEFQF